MRVTPSFILLPSAAFAMSSNATLFVCHAMSAITPLLPAMPLFIIDISFSTLLSLHIITPFSLRHYYAIPAAIDYCQIASRRAFARLHCLFAIDMPFLSFID